MTRAKDRGEIVSKSEQNNVSEASETIDFKKLAGETLDAHYDYEGQLAQEARAEYVEIFEKALRSVAEQVERATIERCAEYVAGRFSPEHSSSAKEEVLAVERLYSKAGEGTEQASEGDA